MAINVTIDGTLYEGVEVITVGGKTLTLAYSAAGDSGDNPSGDNPSGGGTTEAVLPDGYTAYFDFRNNVETSVGAGNLYMCHATEGEGHLYSWYNVFDGKISDEGITDPGSNTYAKSNATNYEFPETFTYCGFMKNHNSNDNKVMLPSDYVVSSNIGIVLRGTYYKTDGSKADTNGSDIGKLGDGKYYAFTTIRVNGAKLDIFVNGILSASFDGNDYDGFSYWSNIVGATILPFGLGIGIGLVLYEKALSDVEVQETYAYFKTLEVA